MHGEKIMMSCRMNLVKSEFVDERENIQAAGHGYYK